MGSHVQEVIRVGDPPSRILQIDRASIEHIDMSGQKQSIDLEECARNWVRWCDDHILDLILVSGASKADADAWNARCVGERGALSDPPWVQFMNERNTRFEFSHYEAVYTELLGLLLKMGWHTFDTE